MPTNFIIEADLKQKKGQESSIKSIEKTISISCFESKEKLKKLIRREKENGGRGERERERKVLKKEWE